MATSTKKSATRKASAIKSSSALVKQMMSTPSKAQIEKIVDTPIVPTSAPSAPTKKSSAKRESVVQSNGHIAAALHFAHEAGGIDNLRSQVEAIGTVLSANLKP